MQKKRTNSPYLKNDSKEDLPIRLNKFIANAGACNRREADEFIEQGLVKVNGKVVNSVGLKVNMDDRVELDGQRVYPGKKVFVLLNKPKDFSCQAGDKNDKTVLKLVEKAFETKAVTLHSLGKTEKGLVVISNDIQLAQNISKGSNKIISLFKIEIDQPMKTDDFDTFSKGVKWKDELIKPIKMAYVDDNKNVLGLEINVNDSSILEQLFNSLGYKIVDLDRAMYNGLTKKNLARGQWRYLTEREVIQLRKNAKK
ncbi:MAG: S4 domain-containing protein [Chitinophagales bacterium]